MAMFETWLKSDLKKPVVVHQLDGNMFTADNQGNKVGVEVTDNGQAATLSGGVMGYIIRADNATVTVQGTLSGNRASIILPQSAYIYPGRISIVIKVGSTTVGACTAYVYKSTTDTLIDPGHVIPSVEELLEKIAACEAATTAATNAASSANSAATSATNAASSATSAASSANSAASSATSAASSANTAAGKINNMTVAASGLDAGSSPTATISEVGGHKHIAFGIPKGDKGNPGDDGDDGADAYVWIRYAAAEPTQDSDMKTTPDEWIGIYSGASETAPTAYTSYTWYKYKGETGNTGTSAYCYIRYAATQPTQDSDMSTTPNDWMGIYSGSSATAPTTYTSYQWYKIKGETGSASNVYGNTIPMSSTDSTKVSEAIAAKYTKPSGGIPGTDLASGVIPGDMSGASSSAAGTHGLVPAPSAGDEGKYLKGDGTWGNPPQRSDSSIVDLIYPVGSIYMSVANTSPSTLFGGTWTQLEDRFLIGASADNAQSPEYPAGDIGGAASQSYTPAGTVGSHTLTTDEIPSHNHTFTGSEVTSGNQSADHTHNYTDYYATTTGNCALTSAQNGSHSHSASMETSIQYTSISRSYGYVVHGNYVSNYTNVSTSSSGSGNNHNHSGANTSTTRTSQGVSADHTHKVTAEGSIGNTGGGGGHDHGFTGTAATISTLPPYLAVYMWKRTA